VQPPKNAIVKKDVKTKVAAKNGCDGRLIAKILITTIQVNLVLNCNGMWRGNINLVELALLKYLLLAYHHSHSWPPPWISHCFFTMAFLRVARFFYSWVVFGLDLFKWIKRFLSDRTQQVLLNGRKSFTVPVTSGGSVLRPLLFSIFINDLPSIVSSSIFMFADNFELCTVNKTT